MDSTLDSCSGPELKLHYSIHGFSAPGPSTIAELVKDVSCAGVMIVKTSPDVVVKFGAHITTNEAKNMIYVAQNAESVPVPKVYAYYILSIEILGTMEAFSTYTFS